MVRRFLRVERRVLASKPRPRTGDPRLPEPAGAREILAAIARAYEAGSAITITQARQAAGCSGELAGTVRLWAMQEGLWPYEAIKREPGWVASWARQAAAEKGGAP